MTQNKPLSEAKVRKLRNAVFLQESSDKNWEECKSKWMEECNIKWLQDRAESNKRFNLK